MKLTILFCIIFLLSCQVDVKHRKSSPQLAEQNPQAIQSPSQKKAETSSAKAEQAKENLVSDSTEFGDGGYLGETTDLMLHCLNALQSIPGDFSSEDLTYACSKVQAYKSCRSTNGDPIFHLTKEAKKPHAKRILTFALVHGDEVESGTVARSWMERLSRIQPRNTWRVIPILNPDGYKKRHRTNANGVDINRNFPSKDWKKNALKYWQARTRSNKRKYPGPGPASESETRCAIEHVQNFKPDMIIAIHTPLGVLDFDGPKLSFPKYGRLPWIRLGHYPGSMGRYMWFDQGVPVLTIELKAKSSKMALQDIDRLQDVSGAVAILANRALKKKKNHQ